MINKTIHYCWFGRKEYNDVIIKCIDSWKKHLPDYELKLWNEDNSPMENRFVKKMYKEKKYAFVSDYVRLYALFNEGGIYLDTDMEILKNIDVFLLNKCFLGFEDIENVSCGIIGSEPGNNFISECLQAYSKLNYPINIPKIITIVLRKHGLNSYGEQLIKDVYLYPKEVFYPWPYKTVFDPIMISENSYAIHHWQHGWSLSKKDHVIKKLNRFFSFNRFSMFI